MEAFKIMGIAVRTLNKEGQAQTDINNLWNRWFKEEVAGKIPNKVSDNIYNMYTDYESDEHGPYTTILGCAVHNLDSIPNGLVGKEIPTGKYKEFISNGKLPDCIQATWKMIWGLKFDRSYSADFDVYDLQAMDPENAQVKTFLSIN